jgi:hypothetical protein
MCGITVGTGAATAAVSDEESSVGHALHPRVPRVQTADAEGRAPLT